MPVFMSTHLNDSLRPTACSIADIEFLRLTIENRAHPPFLRAFRPPLTIASSLALNGLASAFADITIGVSLPLTGPASGLGIQVNNQLKLWRTSIAGEKIRLVVLDDATDPTAAVKNAKRFVVDEKVDVIIGSVATPVAIPISAVAADSETVQLSLSPIPLPVGKDNWTFRMAQSNPVMEHAVIGLMKKQGIKTVGFLGYSDAFGESWLQDFTTEAGASGIKVVAAERFARAIHISTRRHSLDELLHPVQLE